MLLTGLNHLNSRSDPEVFPHQQKYLQTLSGRGDQGGGEEELHKRDWILWILSTEATQAVSSTEFR